MVTHGSICLLSAAIILVAETNASAVAFIRRITNHGTAVARAHLDGQTWQRSEVLARGQRSMYLTSAAGLTLVVTGNATWAELSELARSLHPLAR